MLGSGSCGSVRLNGRIHQRKPPSSLRKRGWCTGLCPRRSAAAALPCILQCRKGTGGRYGQGPKYTTPPAHSRQQRAPYHRSHRVRAEIPGVPALTAASHNRPIGGACDFDRRAIAIQAIIPSAIAFRPERRLEGGSPSASGMPVHVILMCADAMRMGPPLFLQFTALLKSWCISRVMRSTSGSSSYLSSIAYAGNTQPAPSARRVGLSLASSGNVLSSLALRAFLMRTWHDFLHGLRPQPSINSASRR